MSPLERAARALAERNAPGTVRLLDRWIDQQWRHYLPDALAVLRAIREADEGMTLAGEDAAWDSTNSMPAIRAVPKMWNAMIDTLLSTPTPNPQRAKDAGGQG